jgi:hypothetical protein
MAIADRSAREKYAQLIAGLLQPPPGFHPVCEDEATIQVERGLMLAMALCEHPDLAGILMCCERLLQPGAEHARVVDAVGHQRPIYRLLLVYAWRQTLARVESFLTPAQASEWATALSRWAYPLVKTGNVVEDAWSALASGDPASIFERVGEDQNSSGAFLKSDPSQNPEVAWFDELVLLHAVAAYAARSRSPRTEAAAGRAAAYHLNETQPDHATDQPWGLLAFILNPATQAVADQMLHTARVQSPNGARGVTAILLADVLDCLRELGPRCR